MRNWTPVFVLLVACGGSAPPAPSAQEPTVPATTVIDEEIEPVGIELIADVARVAPGTEFVLATRFDMQPEWHIYWINPGESGLPTKVELSGPPGFEIGEVRYPGPSRFESPGPVVSYGYSGAAALSAIVRVPDDAGEGPFEFSVSASWLACKDACIRGRGETTLVIASGERDPISEPVLADHEANLPRALDELSPRIEWLGEGEQLELVIELPGVTSAELFPSVGHERAISGTAVVPIDDGAAVRIAYDEPPESTSGVIAVTRDDAVSYFELEIPTPADQRP